MIKTRAAAADIFLSESYGAVQLLLTATRSSGVFALLIFLSAV